MPAPEPNRQPPVVIPEVLPPEINGGANPLPPPLAEKPLWLSKRRLALAFAIAAASDAISVFSGALAPPVQMLVDAVTAALLFVVLGWRWPLLAGLVMEAMPGLAIFPAWVMVVGAIALFGSPRPPLK